MKILPCRRSGIEPTIAGLRFRMDARMIDSGYFTVNPASYPDGFTITLEHQPKNSGLLISEVGKQTFLKPANRKSANAWAHSAIANLKISWVCQP